MQNELPEWAATVARETVVGTMAQASPLFIDRVARALVAAERRGIGRAKNATCDGCATGVPINEAGYHQQAGFTFPCTASAIRQLGETTW